MYIGEAPDAVNARAYITAGVAYPIKPNPLRKWVWLARPGNNGKDEVNSMAVECIPCSSFVPGNLSSTRQRSPTA